MGKQAAQLIAAEMKKKPAFVLGLATGSTPISLYQELSRLNRAGEIDFSQVSSFNLDEYVGLLGTHDQSYRYFMNKNLFDHVNIDKKRTHAPDGMAKDLEAHCAEYEKMMKEAGGVDYQVLGIGSNGHIGFNEPGSSLASRTRVVDLTENTIKDNSRFFTSSKDVPTKAISMGIGTILESKHAVLVANGANKAEVVAASIEGCVTASVPASALQFHPAITWVITKDAATKLKRQY